MYTNSTHNENLIAVPPLPPEPPYLNFKDLLKSLQQATSRALAGTESTLCTPPLRAYIHLEKQVSCFFNGKKDIPSEPELIQLPLNINSSVQARTITIPGIGSDLCSTQNRAEKTGTKERFLINGHYQQSTGALKIAKATHQAVTDLLEENPTIPLILSGHSTGGIIAHSVAEQVKRTLNQAPLAVVTYSTPLNPEAGFFPRVARIRNIMDALNFNGNPSGRYPYLSLYGTQDGLVPAVTLKNQPHEVIHQIQNAFHTCTFSEPSQANRLKAAVRLATYMATRKNLIQN